MHRQSYTALMGMVSNPVELLECFENQPGNKACGTDKQRKSDYDEGVEERIEALSANLRRLSYRSKPSRRVYIPKGHGKFRALGIPCFEDRIVQQQFGNRNFGTVRTDSGQTAMHTRHWHGLAKSSLMNVWLNSSWKLSPAKLPYSVSAVEP